MYLAVERISRFFALGLVVLVSSCSSDGDSDDPGSGGNQEPATPENVGMFPSPTGYPLFEIRWVLPASLVEVASFKVYQSDQEFDNPEEATVVAVSPATFWFAQLEVKQGTGVRHFRVSAVSKGGVEGALSAELAIDTTSRLFFLADRITNDVVEAFSTTGAGGTDPVKLSGALVPGGSVERMFPSPDGRRAAFVADKDTDEVLELYVAPLDGSAPPGKVSGTSVPSGGLQPFRVAWSPDGRKLAFAGDKVSAGVFELFVTPADGSSQPVRISGGLVAGGDVDLNEFAWSPDGTQVAFLADKQTDGVKEIFVAPATGSGEVVKASGTLVAGGQVESFAWSPDGLQIAMRASKVTAGVHEIFVADPSGETEPYKVSGNLFSFSTINSAPLWSPDSTRLLFSGDLLTNGVVELFVTASDGSTLPQRVSGAAQVFSEVVEFQWSPVGSQAAFIMDKAFNDAHEVYVTTPGSGQEPVRVSGQFFTGTNASKLQWSPRGRLVAFIADTFVDEQLELFVADSLAADSAVSVSGNPVANTDVAQFAWSPDGLRLAMVGDLITDEVSELFVTSLAAIGTVAKVSGPLVAGGDVNGTFFGFTPLSN